MITYKDLTYCMDLSLSEVKPVSCIVKPVSTCLHPMHRTMQCMCAGGEHEIFWVGPNISSLRENNIDIVHVSKLLAQS